MKHLVSDVSAAVVAPLIYFVGLCPLWKKQFLAWVNEDTTTDIALP